MNMQALGILKTGGRLGRERWGWFETRCLSPVRRNLHAFWRWWWGELITVLPARLKDALSERSLCVFLQIDQDMLIVARGTYADRSELFRLPVSSRGEAILDALEHAATRVLLLSPGQALTSSLVLPLAAEENLREALSFEIPRRSPFTEDQVYFDYRVRHRDSRNRTMSVDLMLAPRRLVDPLLAQLSRLDLAPNVVSVDSGTPGEVLPINLLPKEQRHYRNRTLPGRMQAAMIVAAAVLVALAVAAPLVKKSLLLSELEPELAAAVAEVRDSDRLSDQVRRLAAGMQFLVEQKRSGLSVLRTIDELTRSLPDNTWIQRLDINKDRIQLQGQSSSAPLLISILEGSPLFRNVTFQSPVTQVPNTDEERFHLSADLALEDGG